jgi:Holliday junction DNA helicase RuvA
MIARLRGKPVALRPEGLILDVGGVGYLVAATPRATRDAETADEITVETYLHVREDMLQLYGFADLEERALFELLMTVQGIGPKVALAIVSGSTPAELRRAIALEDLARFMAIPGIGKKTAQRVVMELKEKVGGLGGGVVELDGAGSGRAGAAGVPGHLLAREALIGLGFSLAEAEERLTGIDPDLPAEERVKLALRVG